MNITKQMIRYSFALPLLFTCLSLSSCSEEKETETTLPSGPKATFSANAVTAETRSASTRVALTPGANISNSDALSWQVGDLLNFRFFSGTSSVASTQPFEVTQVESDGSAVIEGIVPDISGTRDIVSIYPYKAAFQNGNNPTITLPDAQTQASVGNFAYLKEHLYLRAKLANGIDIISSTNYDVKGVLNYNLLTSLLRFDIKNSTGQNITIKSLNLKIDDSNTSGTFYTSAILNVPNGTLTGQTGTRALTLNVPNVSLSDNDSYIGYLSVLPSSSAGALVLTVDVLDKDNNAKSIELDLTNVPAFESGKRYAASIQLVPEDFIPSCPAGSHYINGDCYSTFNFGDFIITRDPMKFGHASFNGQWYSDPTTFDCTDGWRVPTTNEINIIFNRIYNGFAVQYKNHLLNNAQSYPTVRVDTQNLPSVSSGIQAIYPLSIIPSSTKGPNQAFNYVTWSTISSYYIASTSTSTNWRQLNELSGGVGTNNFIYYQIRCVKDN